jgi:hypothetical protein
LQEPISKGNQGTKEIKKRKKRARDEDTKKCFAVELQRPLSLLVNTVIKNYEQKLLEHLQIIAENEVQKLLLYHYKPKDRGCHSSI